jgi:hypothetical protein
VVSITWKIGPRYSNSQPSDLESELTTPKPVPHALIESLSTFAVVVGNQSCWAMKQAMFTLIIKIFDSLETPASFGDSLVVTHMCVVCL